MADPAIREVGADEFERAWPVFHEIAARGDTYTYPTDLTLETARAMWTTAPARCFVAEVDGRVVGCYRLAPNQMPGSPGDHVANGSYMVASDARGYGVGAALCAHSLDEARRSGFLAMQFNFVVGTNVGAIRLWQRHGFAIVGTLPKAFRHPLHGFVDGHVMYRML